MFKKIVCLLCLLFVLCGCSGESDDKYKIGICNYVDDASLNQIVENIEERLNELGDFEIIYDNANADANVMNQIIANFVAEDVDLMVGVATPVAMAMQGSVENIPIIFSAVSDPLGCGLVDSLEVPGSNISGTSDYLDTESIMNLMFVNDDGIKKVGLLYDVGQDSSTVAIKDAKKYLENRGIEYIERTATNVSEVQLAVMELINDDVDAIFTPTDNTIMQAELSIYEELNKAGIPHYCGADSFALNGAFLGYGVDYINLGKNTADMIYEVLVNGQDIAKMAVRTFDNGTATINIETCESLGLNYEEVKEKFMPYCTNVQMIKTA